MKIMAGLFRIFSIFFSDFFNNPLTYFPWHFLAKFCEIVLSGLLEIGIFPRKSSASTNERIETL